MTKLRTILQSRLLIIFLGTLTIFYVYYKANDIPYDENRLGDNTVTGTIKDTNDNSITIDDTIIYLDNNTYTLGMKVKCEGVITLPSSNTNFNLFNYQNFLASQNIFYIMDGNCIVIEKEVSLIYKIKNSLLNRTDKLKSGSYIKAFTLGITDDIDDTTLSNYRLNGISHLFSISGMHISFLIALLSFIKRKYIIAIILLFYLVLLGFPASMMRAVFFYIILRVNEDTKLNIKTPYLFLYLTIIMLLYNPYNIYNIGFIYSYLITFFLILYSKNLNGKNYLVSTLKISILIFIITIPINIQNNFYLNFLSPIFNLIFIPLISYIIFPLSFITLIFPIVDDIYMTLCNILENLSNFCATINIFTFSFHKMNLIIFILYYLLIIFIMHKISFKEYKYIGVIVILLIYHYFYPSFKDEGMILILDVGQGDSILITLPQNKLNILIDTGGYYSSNIVSNVTIPTLRSLGIQRLDYLILSHGDYDHMGESINLINNFDVINVIFNYDEFNELEQELIKKLDEKNIKYYQKIKELNIDNNKLYFLNNELYDNENDNSNVICAEINGSRVLLMGDAGVEVEKDILEKYNLKDIDILKVGHHGSKTSSSKVFIDSIEPKYSVISVGKTNRYGHPNDEVLNNLENSTIYRTDLVGAVRFKLGKNKLEVETCVP